MRNIKDDNKHIELEGLFEDSYYSIRKREEKESFLEPDSEEYVTVPIVYWELLARYCYERFPDEEKFLYDDYQAGKNLPKIELSIEYNNILDKHNSDTLFLYFEPINYKTYPNNDAAAGCTFRIRTETKRM